MPWVELRLPKRDVEVTNPHPCEGDLIWKEGLCGWNQDNMRSYWMGGGGLNPMTGVLRRKAKFGHRDPGRDWE